MALLYFIIIFKLRHTVEQTDQRRLRLMTETEMSFFIFSTTESHLIKCLLATLAAWPHLFWFRQEYLNNFYLDFY